ncbi:MAG: shikimate dehydrogenase, partial [Gammaproteobacteria bacterium]|nr:shikimate dehydrogenase [Gammaproteobacteria bacterium]
MSLYAVVGNPVEHSKSPQIHHLFAEQTGQDLEYLAIRVEAGGFAAFVGKFFADGGKGLNVTVPFKEAAFELADYHTQRAALAKSANTLFLGDEATLHGDNTDGIGLVNDLQQNNSVSIQGNRILMLGAGGAVRGALAELVNHQAASITILNRTLSKAEQLVSEFDGLINMHARDYGSF